MIITWQAGNKVRIGCSKECHWYRDLTPGAICVCGKERLEQRKDYQPVQFNKLKIRSKKKKK